VKITVEGLEGLPEVGPGDDLAGLIAQAAPQLRDGDVVVVTSKIVSKAEGRLVTAADAAARRAVIDTQTARIVAAWDDTRIVATHHGFVVAAAGVDSSNTRPGTLLLLPEDPDASARRIRAGLRERLGVRVGVVVTDTFGRPWRSGQTDVAVGAAGLTPVEDLRGRVDAWGNTLGVTVLAVADEVAAAADLVKRKLAGMPVAVVQGLGHLVLDSDGPGASALVRPLAEDRFPLGAAEAARAGVWAAVLGTTSGVEAAAGDELPPGAQLPLLTPVTDHVGERLRHLVNLVKRTTTAGLDWRVHQAGSSDSGSSDSGSDPAGRTPQDHWYVEVRAATPGTAGDAGTPAHATPPPALLVEAGRALERVRVLARGEGLVAEWVDGPVLGRLRVAQRSR
jgi:coenzyme F420-0:L-glutamate ligase